MEEYVSKAKITSIKAVSRAAIKIRDNFYTVEYQEERSLPEDVEFDIEQERQLLWDETNKVVDNQIQEILTAFRK